MRLGYNLGYWGTGVEVDNLALAQEADRLGCAVAWVSESYGSDAVTVLTWVAAHTARMDLGSAVMQIPARSPAMTAMTAATLDTLSGGRFRLGLGVSGPQVSEGWHGVRFSHPLGRTREYVEIVRAALRRRPVTHRGRHYPLPLLDGPGEPLALAVRATGRQIPLYLAAIGPRNLELTGEIADGWLSTFLSPEHAGRSLGSLAAGRARAGGTLDGFDVVATAPVVLGDDLETAAARLRPSVALYLGGMGSREENYYNALAGQMGYPEEAARIQDLYLDGEYKDAAEAVPFGFIDQTSLLGPVDRIADRIRAYADAGVTTLALSVPGDSLEPRLGALRAAVAAAERSGVVD